MLLPVLPLWPSCLQGKIRAFSCSIRLYTNRNNRLSHPSFWAPAMLSCGG